MKKILFAVAAIIGLAACTGTEQSATLQSGLDPAKFDTIIGGDTVKLYTLKNDKGMEVSITNYGGRVVSLVVPDKDGKPTDVVLGYDNIAQYADTVNSPSDYGSSVGRYANRIEGAKFTLNDTVYNLRPNDGPNCLHGGGDTGWMNKVYKAEQIGNNVLKLTIVAEDGENGFPGTITATTTATKGILRFFFCLQGEALCLLQFIVCSIEFCLIFSICFLQFLCQHLDICQSQ